MEVAAKKRAFVRFVAPEDAPRLADIYAPYVEETTISFEYFAPTAVEFERRIRSISSFCPYLVYCEDNEIVGYAYGRPAFERAAYAWRAETTVYVDPAAQGRGVGRALYSATLRLLSEQGYRGAYAVVVAENEASCRFHLDVGFRLAAIFPNSGYKFGRWLDVAWYEKNLGEFSDEVEPPRIITEVPRDVAETICREAIVKGNVR